MKNAFFIALGFLTRLPVTFPNEARAFEKHSAIAFYPAVGLIIGSILWFFAFLLRGSSPLLASAIVVLVWISITGALHLDGLADCADAWIGGLGDQNNTLKIMKDPSVGSISVVVLIIIILLKIIAVSEIVSYVGTTWLLIIPVLARCSSIALFMTTRYVSEDGLGQDYAKRLSSDLEMKSSNKYRVNALVTSALFTIILFGLNGFLLIGVSILIFYIIRQMAISKIKGFTGDVVGAMIELVELASCLFVIFIVL